ncbi:MAG: TIGR03084 family protein [Nocardioidaceae bacterium]|nr:TIGR03084 family protein [Nocardioidaceae bacterium]
MSRLEEVLADLAAEGDRLDGLVADLAEPAWRTPTPAAGWTVAHQVAHLAWTDECAIAAATDKEAWDDRVLEAIVDPDGFVDREAEAGASVPPADLLARWRGSRQTLAATLRGLPEGTRIPWYGPPMSATSMATARFMETWAHARDVADALDVPLPPEDRVRHVVHIGVRTRDYSFRNRGLEPPAEEVHVRPALPGGEVLAYGDPSAAQSVTGSAQDFALLVTQRVHRDDTDLAAVGADADAWLDVAQAFAGPTGDGRPPRG